MKPGLAAGGRLYPLLPLVVLSLATACEYRESPPEASAKSRAPATGGREIVPSAPTAQPHPPTGREAATRLSFLRASGREIVDEAGRPVQLRGCNLGSWLLIEPWMIGIDEAQASSEKDLWDALYVRMESNDVHRLMRFYRENFVTAEDISYIRSLGLNLVRIPVWWRVLDDPAYGGGWEQLDRIIRLCEENGIYVILDLHGAPGGQSSKAAIVGEPTSAELWSEPQYREKTVQLWRRIAERYRERAAVAGYDLLNEAYESSFADLLSLYDRIYRTIRSVDPRHIVFLEDGFHGLHRFPPPEELGWSNVVLSFHYYPANPGESFRAPRRIIARFARVGIAYDLPLYVGEFNTIELARGGADMLRRYCEIFDYYHWLWTMWSYKAAMADRDVNWGIYGYRRGEPTPVDLARISPADLAEFFAGLRSSNLVLNRTLAAAVSWRRSWPAGAASSDAEVAFRSEVRDFILLPTRPARIRIEWQWPRPNVGYWAAGEAVVARLDIPQDGVYELFMVVAHDGEGCAADMFLDGVYAGRCPVPPTESWRRYVPVSLGCWRLACGRHFLRLQPAPAEEEDAPFVNLREIYGIPTDREPAQPDARLIRLSPFTVRLPSGSPFRIEWNQDIPDIGFWRSSQPVEWVLDWIPEGRYRISVEYASPQPVTRISIRIDDSWRQDISLHATGGWHAFKEVAVGTVLLPAGRHAVKVSWQTSSPEGAGNLRSVILRRMSGVAESAKGVEPGSPSTILKANGPET